MNDNANDRAESIYDFALGRLDGSVARLGEYRGRVLLVVNVASRCGFTSQYTGLEALYRKYQSQGFEVLGFPCNQFGDQEPGDADEIRSFCSTTYDVTFPLFAKIDVNGDEASPLYRWLKTQAKGILGTESIKWNFTKFLVNRRGEVIERFASTYTPQQLEGVLEKLLAEPA